MTHKERFIKTLKCEPIGGLVPHFELCFYLTMEAMGKMHPEHRSYHQWNQMSAAGQRAHLNDIANTYIEIAKKYNHDAIFLQAVPGGLDNVQIVLEMIREKTGEDYFIMMHGDPTWAMPDGENMVDFSVQMYEEPEKLNDISKRRVERTLENAAKLNQNGHLLDCYALCSDYCFNVNPFFTPDLFDELITPYLKESIQGYHDLGYYVIKHTDGNIMPIVKQIADCKPDAIHSLDPQGGVSIPEVRKAIGDDICLIGNVNCGLMQTGTDEEAREDILRSLRQGMERGYGYVFTTSNCVYTGMPLERYDMMVDLRNKYGWYEDYQKNFG